MRGGSSNRRNHYRGKGPRGELTRAWEVNLGEKARFEDSFFAFETLVVFEGHLFFVQADPWALLVFDVETGEFTGQLELSFEESTVPSMEISEGSDF